MLEVIAPALAAAILIALTHAPLGIEVLRRGIIFIDLAIAQVAGLGIVVAYTVLGAENGLVVAVFALVFALIAAVFFRWIENRPPQQQEAIIGSTFVVAASLALLLLADHPHGGEEIQHLLSGQILFTSWGEVLTHAPVYVLVLALWFLWPRARTGLWFFALFALAITSSVQLVGVFVVFASLILPALATAGVKENRHLLAAWSCSLLSVFSGIGLSVMTDLPTGPVLVCSFAVWCIVFRLVQNTKL